MQKINCKLISHSMSRHIQQIYTGFLMLYKRGLVNVTQEILKENILDTSKPQHLRDARHAFLRVIVSNNLKLCYDTHDSWEIDEEYLNWADFYFKRSFSSFRLEGFKKNYQKIYPLGLNYLIYPDSIDKFGLQRSVTLTDSINVTVADKIKSSLLAIAGSLDLLDGFVFTPRVNTMESLPDVEAPPKILFMVRTWDPYDNPERNESKVKETIDINETRASCIKLLRNAFGENFYGGFIHTDFAKKNYEDLLLPDNTLSSKRNYINLLRSFPICLATTGLHGSIGWKFAEYVAFSKAILSEKLNYEIPGDFREGKNYVEFVTPEDCVEKANQLFSDRELRNQLMANNAGYYQRYLRPDSLVLNTILTALSEH